MVTTRYPRRPDSAMTEGIRVAARPADNARWRDGMEKLCPTGAIGPCMDSPSPAEDARVSLDQGRCIGCGICVRDGGGSFTWEAGPAAPALTRAGLIVPEADEDPRGLTAVREALARRTRALGQSIHIRHVDTGSDGSEEWEILALLNPVYDVHRLGIFFTASPRHADILLVTGAGAVGMAGPLRRTLQGTPAPVVVIAAGTDAISGGLVSPTYATAGGIAEFVDVDVWVPGSPPTPFALLRAILVAVGRLPMRGG